ncbi:hypothetical protein [Actinokineospora guangxiensis]|uniref:hypothetical protein n=1 Tax=Actinokineospora guangxiensis TaxID=1490288 RepID=UPI003673310F
MITPIHPGNIHAREGRHALNGGDRRRPELITLRSAVVVLAGLSTGGLTGSLIAGAGHSTHTASTATLLAALVAINLFNSFIE